MLLATQLLTGRYRLIAEVGRGGMATVYECVDEKHQRRVALKVFRADLSAAIGADRFLREIAITAGLNHPHILPLLDSGADHDLFYYVMPFVAGGSLRRLLRLGVLPLDAVTRIASEVAGALDYAHDHGVIHRDIKPENILFNEGVAVVSDFGIALGLTGSETRMTGTGVSVGTLGYMSPEQALGAAALDARTDVYSLGCVVYEMLVSELPTFWPGPEDIELGRFSDLPAAHRKRLDNLPGRVEQVLVRALALRPAHRFARTGELADALAAATQPTASFSDEQVRQLLQRAAELQTAAMESSLATESLTMGAVEQIAAQVGIPPVHVREAAHDLAVSAATPPQDLQRPRWDRLVYTDAVPGEAPVDVFPAMVTQIERCIGVAGHATVIGGTLTWSPAAQSEESRKVVIQVSAQEGSTTIRIQEDFDIKGPRALAIPGGIIMGGAFGAAAGFMLGLAEPAGPLLAALLAAAGALTAVRTVVWVASTEHAPHLAKLKAELAASAAAAIEKTRVLR